jgi:hypothetical protein
MAAKTKHVKITRNSEVSDPGANNAHALCQLPAPKARIPRRAPAASWLLQLVEARPGRGHCRYLTYQERLVKAMQNKLL